MNGSNGNVFRNDEMVILSHYDKKDGCWVETEYPKVGGRLRLAHEDNEQLSITTEVIQYDGNVAVVKASAKTRKGEFTGLGMASIERDAKIAPAILELAETRSIARCLRFSGYGVEYCGAEEVSHLPRNGKDDEPSEEKPRQQSKSGGNGRGNGNGNGNGNGSGNGSANGGGDGRITKKQLNYLLLKEVHAVLLAKGRGRDRTPGEFRRSQNRIGGTRPGNASFVPPPAEKVMDCLGRLELFLHDQPVRTPVLLKSALAHVQFETIHPFLDGNGRLGRLLITMLLCQERVLREPMLYLSLYFKTHRQYYYELLNNVRLTGDWEAWLNFFAEAVTMTANQAVDTAQRVIHLAGKDRELIGSLGRAAESAIKIHTVMLERPLATSGWLVEKTGLTAATVNKALTNLERLSILKELTRRKRNRVFGYDHYINIMNEGAESFV